MSVYRACQENAVKLALGTAMGGAVVGALTGLVFGYMVGYGLTYNPQKSERYAAGRTVGLLGIPIGALLGGVSAFLTTYDQVLRLNTLANADRIAAEVGNKLLDRVKELRKLGE